MDILFFLFKVQFGNFYLLIETLYNNIMWSRKTEYSVHFLSFILSISLPFFFLFASSLYLYSVIHFKMCVEASQKLYQRLNINFTCKQDNVHYLSIRFHYLSPISVFLLCLSLLLSLLSLSKYTKHDRTPFNT